MLQSIVSVLPSDWFSLSWWPRKARDFGEKSLESEL